MACWNLVYRKIGFKQEQEFKPVCRGRHRMGRQATAAVASKWGKSSFGVLF